MAEFTLFGRPRGRALFIIALAAGILLTLACALRFATPVDGICDCGIQKLDSGWFYISGGTKVPLGELPCSLDEKGDTLVIVRDIGSAKPHSGDILAIQTRYQSISVTADGELIYTAAQGKEHALSSMWHFISSEKYGNASELRVELTRYTQGSAWNLSDIFQDHTDSIIIYLIQFHAPALLVWLCCMIFTLFLLFAVLFMTIRKVAGISILVSLGSFIFLSGTWILLDTKITTIAGGNYALTYFFSYLVFYLLPIPLLFFFQLILKQRNRFMMCLIWVTAGNAIIWMLMHLLNIIFLQKTAVSVHAIIIVFLIFFLREFFRREGSHRRKRLLCTFFGIFLILTVGILSIVMYHADLLKPTNSSVMFAWSIMIMILCMAMDAVMMFHRLWKEQNHMKFYRQLATEDSMTGLANRNAYEFKIQSLADNPPSEISFIMFDIDQLKVINDTYGHQTGDQVISLTAGCIGEVFGKYGECYRIGGDEFCVILTSHEQIADLLRQFDGLVEKRNRIPFPLRISHGWETREYPDGSAVSVNDIIELKTASDKKLYLHKSACRIS